MIVEELYDALIEAGASEEKARAASRAIADTNYRDGPDNSARPYSNAVSGCVPVFKNLNRTAVGASL